MRLATIVMLLALLSMPFMAYAADTTEAAAAWFTDADIANCIKTAKPADALPEAPGCEGKGVLLTKSVAIENPLLQQKCGYISFWIKPNWKRAAHREIE